jgi:hypothetical protein
MAMGCGLDDLETEVSIEEAAVVVDLVCFFLGSSRLVDLTPNWL